uniref:Fucosyltransferase n=1 Tax=Schistosoma mansoni TaxID=6183 RepID=A0A5K4EP96_SCHMA
MIVQRGKWTLRIKAIGFVLIALFIVWLINISPSLLYVGIHNESHTYLSDNMGLIHKDIFDSNSSELELAMILHKSYSTIYETSVQKYSLRFDVEENRLKRLFDSLSKNTSVKTFLNYGSQKIYTPMDFSKCYASKCTVITEMERWHEADALILTKNVKPDGIRPLGQLWFTLIHESPEHISLANTLDNEVDIYGKCGTKICPRNLVNDPLLPDCFKLIRENYKFYLSFENSLCRWYITEKLFKNALKNDILPIVMGASIEEYERVAPPYSFIHVDQFESPAKLADYLKYLDKNDTAYNEYFAWHGHGIIHDWDSQPQCAMCLLAHTSQAFGPYWVPKVARWWNDGCKDHKLRWNL